jgi:kumamolisin
MRALTAVLCLAALAILAAAAPGAVAAPRITFYFGLERPESAARQAFWAVSDPASPAYRRFASASSIGRRFGATAATRRAFRRAASHHGFTARVDASGVFARVTGSVHRFERVFEVRIRRRFSNDPNVHFWSVPGNRGLRLPRDMAPLVRDVVAFYERSSGPATVSARAARAPRNEGRWTGGCKQARATKGYAFAQVRHAYGLDAVGTGAGGSVAILNAGEGVPAKDRATFARCFGLPRLPTRVLRTDGQAKPFGRGTFEPQEDLALVRGMAPGLRSVTFTQVWLETDLWFLGPAQVFAAPRLPDTLSMSYGECEKAIRGRRFGPSSRAGARLMDAVLVRLGLAGVGAFASAGDSGSTCNGQPYPGVAWPASSAFLTAVGGSRLMLDRANRRTDEVVWNDLRWLSKNDGGGAGGGGFARKSLRPPYQSGLGLRGARRAVPDVSAHASMLPGWPVNIEQNWVEDGGTSASAPLVAAAFAVLSARQRAAGLPPLGPPNGLLYASAPSTRFDITSGDNGFTRTVPAHRARPGYDLASGLGVPAFGRLAFAIPPPGR